MRIASAQAQQNPSKNGNGNAVFQPDIISVNSNCRLRLVHPSWTQLSATDWSEMQRANHLLNPSDLQAFFDFTPFLSCILTVMHGHLL